MEYVMFLIAGIFITLAVLERKIRRDMERKIGETFEYLGYKYVVKEANSCEECSFDCEIVCTGDEEISGECLPHKRKDGKKIIFLEVKNK